MFFIVLILGLVLGQICNLKATDFYCNIDGGTLDIASNCGTTNVQGNNIYIGNSTSTEVYFKDQPVACGFYYDYTSASIAKTVIGVNWDFSQATGTFTKTFIGTDYPTIDGTNPDRININKSGWYSIKLITAGSSTTSNIASITLSTGVNYLVRQTHATGANFQTPSFFTGYLAAGSYVSARHNYAGSGGRCIISTGYPCYMSIFLLAGMDAGS